MGGESITQLAVFTLATIIVATIIIIQFRLRLRFGLTPLYVTLGVFQPFQVFLASSIYAEILPGIIVSPGSAIMFTASLFAILLVYIREDALEARKVIYGIMFANLSLSALMLTFGWQLQLPSTLNFLDLSADLFNQSARITIAGTLALFADVLLIIFVYEATCRWIGRSQFLCIYLSLALILIFDSVVFATGAFLGQQNYLTILYSGILGKLIMAIPFAFIVTFYLRFGESTEREPNSFVDIFDDLSYRQRYHLAQERGDQAEAGLKTSEDRFKQLFDNSPVPLWEEDFTELLAYLVNLKQNGITDFKKFFNEHPDELQTCAGKIIIRDVNLETLKLHKAKDKAELLGNLDKIFTEASYEAFRKEVIAINEGASSFEIEGQVKTLDGEIREVALKLQILKDTHTALLATTDITERKQAEGERERLQLAIEQTAEIIMITDPAGYIEYVNPAFETVTGYSREEVLGKTPDLLRSGDQEEDVYQQMWQDLAAGKTWRGHFSNKRKDGSLYIEEACISPISDPQGNITNFVATKHDITHQLALEQQFLQAQKMESIGQLAGGVAHDFNNMLSLIIGRAELGMRKLDPANPEHKTLSEIHNAANRSAKLTQQLLAFARKQEIAPAILDLNSSVESTLQMLQSLIGENIHLTWLPGSSLWPIKIDPGQLDQILTNLALNAQDAISDVGKITIESSTVSFDQSYCDRHPGFKPGDFTKLAISDNGVGMDSETVKKIFEPFYTTKALGQGTGLGLSTVYGIIKQNNGFINVYSEPGQGTTFSIYFPRFSGDVEETDIRETVAISAGQGQMILLVEDDQVLLQLSKELLHELGYKVLATASPKEALEIAMDVQTKIDLLITDVVMPDMNGKELAETLQGQLPELKVLFTSGYTANVIASKNVLDDGINFLQKPLSIHTLAKKLQEIFS